jgi:hypothetical protein
VEGPLVVALGIIGELLVFLLGTRFVSRAEQEHTATMIPREQLRQIAAIVRGVAVWGCLPRSSSARAGVRYGDIVLGANGMRTETIHDYLRARALRTDGVELRLLRGGAELTLFVEFCPPPGTLEELAAQVAEARLIPGEPASSPPKSLPS